MIRTRHLAGFLNGSQETSPLQGSGPRQTLRVSPKVDVKQQEAPQSQAM